MTALVTITNCFGGVGSPVTLGIKKDLRLENVKYLGNNLYRLELDFTLQEGQNLLNDLTLINQKQLGTTSWNGVQATLNWTLGLTPYSAVISSMRSGVKNSRAASSESQT